MGLSFVLAFIITQGIKNMFGKPRPDLLARCQPDLDDIASHVVGGLGQDISSRWTLVSSTICRQTDRAILDEGFRSFLSGHSSMSWSGLLYLSLWLAVKFNVTFPYAQPYRSHDFIPTQTSQESVLPLQYHRQSSTEAEKEGRTPFPRHASAAPPIYGIVLCLIPICVAIYISSTRWVDFKHHGFDIFSGSLLGIITAWLGSRFYHSSLTKGCAWTWGPRSREDAWMVRGGGFSSWETGNGSRQDRANQSSARVNLMNVDGANGDDANKFDEPRLVTPAGAHDHASARV